MTGDDNYPVDIAVVLEDPAWGVEAESICRLAAAAALETAGCEGGDLCIVLSDNAHVASLNSRFRHLEGPTNVLAFAAGAPGLLGDVILAEPGSRIGFAGQSVIKQFLGTEELPEGFQIAESVLEHGFVDRVVSRDGLASTISRLIALLAPSPPPGANRAAVSQGPQPQGALSAGN